MAEGAHVQTKKWLGTANGSFATFYGTMVSYWKKEQLKHQTTAAVIGKQWQLRDKELWKHIAESISDEAIERLLPQVKMAEAELKRQRSLFYKTQELQDQSQRIRELQVEITPDEPWECSGTFSKINGLPCKHIILKILQLGADAGIPAVSIHLHWFKQRQRCIHNNPQYPREPLVKQKRMSKRNLLRTQPPRVDQTPVTPEVREQILQSQQSQDSKKRKRTTHGQAGVAIDAQCQLLGAEKATNNTAASMTKPTAPTSSSSPSSALRTSAPPSFSALSQREQEDLDNYNRNPPYRYGSSQELLKQHMDYWRHLHRKALGLPQLPLSSQLPLPAQQSQGFTYNPVPRDTSWTPEQDVRAILGSGTKWSANTNPYKMYMRHQEREEGGSSH